MKTLMILGGSILQLPAIRQAKKIGLSVVVVDMDPNAIGFLEPGVEREVISTIDIPAVLDAAKRWKIDGIMTLASDMPMRTVAHVGKELGLPAISEDAAFKATDKYAMRQALQQHHVPVPVFFGVTTWDAFQKAAAQLPGDQYIVKPADSSGSRGVHLVHRNDESAYAFQESLRFSRSGTVVIEEFMTGPEVSVESITCNGKTEIIAITDKTIIGNGNFTEIGHAQPSSLSQDIQLEIAQVVKQTITAIGIDNSPSHTELKITPSGVKVVEIGARLGGDNITTHLVPLSTGINMVEACIKIAIGEPLQEYTKQSNSAAIQYIQPPQGIITAIDGIEDARTIPGVQDVQILRRVGDQITPITCSTDRAGFVIAQGCADRSALEICEEAVRRIKIDVESVKA